jgi:hypothetical protein
MNPEFPATPLAPMSDSGSASDRPAGGVVILSKRAWQTPTIELYGDVRRMTQGISYYIGDGISNLT